MLIHIVLNSVNFRVQRRICCTEFHFAKSNTFTTHTTKLQLTICFRFSANYLFSFDFICVNIWLLRFERWGKFFSLKMTTTYYILNVQLFKLIKWQNIIKAKQNQKLKDDISEKLENGCKTFSSRHQKKGKQNNFHQFQLDSKFFGFLIN